MQSKGQAPSQSSVGGDAMLTGAVTLLLLGHLPAGGASAPRTSPRPEISGGLPCCCGWSRGGGAAAKNAGATSVPPRLFPAWCLRPRQVWAVNQSHAEKAGSPGVWAVTTSLAQRTLDGGLGQHQPLPLVSVPKSTVWGAEPPHALNSLLC